MDAWVCPICRYDEPAFERVQDLAAHVVAWHDEWLEGCRVPPESPW